MRSTGSNISSLRLGPGSVLGSHGKACSPSQKGPLASGAARRAQRLFRTQAQLRKGATAAARVAHGTAVLPDPHKAVRRSLEGRKRALMTEGSGVRASKGAMTVLAAKQNNGIIKRMQPALQVRLPSLVMLFQLSFLSMTSRACCMAVFRGVKPVSGAIRLCVSRNLSFNAPISCAQRVCVCFARLHPSQFCRLRCRRSDPQAAAS
jgi:hypothetical protein